jgi:hypothetical protein
MMPMFELVMKLMDFSISVQPTFEIIALLYRDCLASLIRSSSVTLLVVFALFEPKLLTLTL